MKAYATIIKILSVSPAEGQKMSFPYGKHRYQPQSDLRPLGVSRLRREDEQPENFRLTFRPFYSLSKPK